MIVGHYASALIPYARNRDYPFWLLLVCANVPEFLWLLLALVGVEAPAPASLFDATLQNLHVEMTYSHNLLPGLLQALATAAIVYAVSRRAQLTLWCGALVFWHVLCDAVVGYEHQLWGPSSPTTSLNTYASTPHVAIAIELAFAVACVAWFDISRRQAGAPLSGRRRAALYAVFIVGIAAWFPVATTSLRKAFG